MVLYTPGRTSTYPTEPVEGGIRAFFLGGGDEVGNVGCILEDATGTRLLIDYGLAPTKPPKYPAECPPVDDVIITHAHIDHIGMAPWVAGHLGARLHGSPLTASVSEVMWRDTYKVSKIEGYPLAWDRRDMDEALHSWVTHRPGEWFDIGAWRCRFHRAGHIPGAVMVEIETPEARILWSGDMDTRDSPSVLGAKAVECDILFLEGTYGNRIHPSRLKEERKLVDRVLEIVDRGGTALIPAFASGRGQDVLQILRRDAPNLEVHYHGMGTRVTKHWMDHPEAVRDPKGLRKTWRWCRRVSSKSDRRKALEADAIVTTSGMLDGGPAIWYANRLRHSANNAILLTGYQAEESGGRLLLDERKLSIYGDIVPIDIEVEQLYLSNHGGQKELVDFAQECNPKHVVIFHADDESREALNILLGEEMTVHLPPNQTQLLLE